MENNIKYILKERKNPVELPEQLGFGTIFTDHVFEMDYSPKKGWHNAVIKPLELLSIHPATMFIHYGQAIFEGLKAFKTIDDEVVIFRAEDHINRLNNSASRVCIPEVDVQFVMNALKELIALDKDWIPTKNGESLYIRPFAFGVDPVLGVKPASDYKFIILLSPVGAYYPEGFKPVKILVEDQFVRAVRKGLGDCKTPANYAASLLAGQKAIERGFTQVLWLDAIELKYIEEVGTMNIFIRFKDEVVTPKLTGSILPGVTRKSVLQILNDWEMKVSERHISIDEVVEQYKKGNLIGMFGTGTAAIISSVGWLSYKGEMMTFNEGKAGELDTKLFEKLTAIHYGKTEDSYNWLIYVTKKGVEVS